jgi:hypothetical protein
MRYALTEKQESFLGRLPPIGLHKHLDRAIGKFHFHPFADTPEGYNWRFRIAVMYALHELIDADDTDRSKKIAEAYREMIMFVKSYNGKESRDAFHCFLGDALSVLWYYALTEGSEAYV